MPNKNGLEIIKPTSVTAVGSATTSANGSVSFNTADSVTLNGVFSSLYSNYKILLQAYDFDGTGRLNLRLTASGTPATTNYTHQLFFVDSTTLSGSRASAGTFLPTTSIMSTSCPCALIVDIYGPAKVAPTRIRSSTVHVTNPAIAKIGDCAGGHSSSTSYDGFQIYGLGLNGSIAVYGMRE